LNKRLKMIIISAIAATGIMSQVSPVRASETGAEELLQTALSQKTFYSFNMAYDAILKMEDGSGKSAMLSKLDTLTAIVWTEDIRKFNLALDELVQTASGKLYDQIVAEVSNSKLKEMDKGYLLGELTGWGKRLVYTADYTAAVDAVVNAWTNRSENTIKEAETLISKVENSYSREYLLEEIGNVKIKYQNDLDTVNKVNYLLGMSEWSRDEKLAKLQLTFAKSTSIKVPEGYMYTVGGYHILDNLRTVSDIKDLQKVVNNGIAFAEASKFNGGNLQSRQLTFEPNRGDSKIDITDKVLKLSGDLMEETSYAVSSELFWDDPENPLDPSRKAFEIIDGRIYLKPDTSEDIEFDTIAVNVRYKDGSFKFLTWLKAAPVQPEIGMVVQ
jgi:hypothetical protein